MYILYLGWFIISLLTIFTICGLDFGAVLRFMMPKSELVNLSVFMTYYRVSNTNNTTGATCGVGSAYPSESPELTPVVSVVRVTRSLVLCVMFCRLLFVLYLFVLETR
jgi:hypothetical protein